MRKHRDSLSSLDGKRRISAEEFDRLFDEGSDEIDQFIDWSKIEVHASSLTRPITLKIDADVLEWFKSRGKDYQKRINAVLRRYKEARERS